MFEDYTEPDDDEERVEVTVDAPLQERFDGMSPEYDPDPDEAGFTAAHFEHPNGETGIMLVYSGAFFELAQAFDLDVSAITDGPVVVPLRHKADGGYNFCSYEAHDGQVTITMTRSMYEQARAALSKDGR